MKAFVTQLGIQFKNDLRDKDTLLVYYLVPFIFYFVMGSIYNAIPNESGGLSVIAMSVLLTLSMASFLGLPQSLVKAREKGVLQAYRVAGVPEWSLILSSVIIVLVHILIVSAVILLTAPAIFGSALPDKLGQFVLTLILIALCSEALGVLLSAFVKKQSAIGIVGQLLFLPSLMFTGMMFPTSFLPDTFQKIGRVLPAGLGVNIFEANNDMLISIIWLVVILVVAFAIAGAIYKRTSYSK